MREPNEHVANAYNRMAAGYDRQMACFERLMFRGCRQWAVAAAKGEVVEIAVGTGINLPMYGPAVRHVIGVDLSDAMLALARQRVADARLPHVELRHGDVQGLELPDGCADTVVSTYALCTIPDPLAASREAYRLLRPGGRFVLAEHGPSTRKAGRLMMRAVEPLAIRFAADHLTRDPVGYLVDAGFTVDEVHRSGVGGTGFRVLAHKPVA
jgi:ubiquinone/menaquinone biosynthesis C-methylase UbiE